MAAYALTPGGTGKQEAQKFRIIPGYTVSRKPAGDPIFEHREELGVADPCLLIPALRGQRQSDL